jgi:hypothetical protein
MYSLDRQSLKQELDGVWEHAQDRQRTRVQLRSNTLQRRIDAWFKAQELYIPAIVSLRKKKDQEATAQNFPELKPHNIPLLLPSQIHGFVPFDQRLAEIEWQLRDAQAHEALDKLRHALQTRAHLFRFKQKNIRGQGPSTRARTAINQAQARVNVAAAEYHLSRGALESLSASLRKVGWDQVLQPLKESDIRELSGEDEALSHGKQKISWIWRTIDHNENMRENPQYRDGTHLPYRLWMAPLMNY